MFVRLLFLMIGALLIAACGSSDSNSSAGESNIVVTDAWARALDLDEHAHHTGGTASAEHSSTVTNAVYFVIENEGDADDQLVAAATDVAEAVEMHQTTLADNVMQMRQAQEIEIPAGETVVFEPGGYHVMLIGLTESLVAGETFDVTLSFVNAGEIVVPVEVREL